jgi:hypothetical protein
MINPTTVVTYRISAFTQGLRPQILLVWKSNVDNTTINTHNITRHIVMDM